MPDTTYLVLMRPEGRVKPTFAETVELSVNHAWSDVACEAVDKAMRSADMNFEVAGGFQQQPDGSWREIGWLSIEHTEAMTTRFTIPRSDQLPLVFDALMADRGAIKIAAETLGVTGLDTKAIRVASIEPEAPTP